MDNAIPASTSSVVQEAAPSEDWQINGSHGAEMPHRSIETAVKDYDSLPYQVYPFGGREERRWEVTNPGSVENRRREGEDHTIDGAISGSGILDHKQR
jgi:hypothetical protein